MVDNFGVKYTNKDDTNHLFIAIKEKYPLKIDWTGTKYIGINVEWDYKKREVKLSMKGYAKQALQRFQHPTPSKHHYGPTKYVPLEYEKNTAHYGGHITRIDSTVKNTYKRCVANSCTMEDQ